MPSKKASRWQEYTNFYANAFFEDLKLLNILPASMYPKASAHIDEMLIMIERLLQSGHAYKSEDDSIYFRIASFKEYGKLSNIKLAAQKTGASKRIQHDEYERDQAYDFALWKAYKENEDHGIYWDSPYGKGRPGWHIECSAMSYKYLGHHFDIHTGGIDNKFPHHENEIAQSEAANPQDDSKYKSYVNYWLHCAHLLVEGHKMSKSLGNFYTLKDLLKKKTSDGAQINSLVIRYMLLSTHYRKPYNFTLVGIDAITKAWQKVNAAIQELISLQKKLKQKSPQDTNFHSETLVHSAVVKEKLWQFKKFLASDLNSAGALGIVFDVVNYIKENSQRFTASDVENYVNFFYESNQILGVFQMEPNLDELKKISKEELSMAIKKLLDQRQQARKKKNWQLSDSLRDDINAQGYQVIDTPQGQQVEKK